MMNNKMKFADYIFIIICICAICFGVKTCVSEYDVDSNESTNNYKGKTVNLKYIPEEFQLESSFFEDDEEFIRFKNSEDMWFDFSVDAVDANFSVDSEGGNAERLTVNGYDAVYFTNKNVNALIWTNGKYLLHIVGNISKDEVVKIAENSRTTK